MTAKNTSPKFKFPSFKISSVAIISSTAILLLAAYNATFWHHFITVYPFEITNLPFIIGMGLLLFTTYCLVLLIFAQKYFLRPLLIILFILSTISAYAMDTFGYVISTHAFENLAATDSHEVSDLLSFKLGLYIFGLLIVPVLLSCMAKINYPTFKRRLLYIVIAVLLIVGNLAIFNKSYVSFLRNHKQVRYYLNPVRPVYSLVKYAYEHVHQNIEQEFNVLDHAPTLAQHDGKPRLVVLIVGESDRAINHQLNGYSRKTNPLLSDRDDIYSFSQVSSCGTETSVSVPCMFSPFIREDYSHAKGRYTENVLDLLQKSNVDVLWRDNDSGCKGVCERITTHDFNQAKIDPYCNSFECHDEVLLHQLQEYIDQKPGDKLIVLHKLGNHGPAYYKRYPKQFEVFTPTCKSNELQDCTDQEIVNTYDNIILYTDYFIDKVIQQLEQNSKQYQTAMIYVSDHGESLGEKGIYLHAMPYWLAPKEQTHVPFFFWSSPDFGIDARTLSELQHQSFSHDNLFHTLLGLYKVQSKVYIQELDMFSS